MLVFIQHSRLDHCYPGFDSYIIRFGTNFDYIDNEIIGLSQEYQTIRN